jgi:20S proteasome subunit alpha 1
MIFGIDEEKGTPELFTCDPAGQFFAHKAASAGPKEKEVMNFLEERMKSKPSLSSGTTKGLAKSALKHVLEGDFYAREFEVVLILSPIVDMFCLHSLLLNKRVILRFLRRYRKVPYFLV